MTNTNKRPIVGLAGGIGSGKSTISKLFNNLGIESVDADDVARNVVEPGSPCLSKIVERYGANILLTDGSLDRKALRNIVFKHPSERVWLESITHPIIRQKIEQQLSNASSKYVLLVHPLLFETQQNTICQLTIAIDAEADTQLKRVTSRDNTSVEQTQKIMEAQLSNSERLKLADLALKNDGNLSELNDKVLKLHENILKQLDISE